MKNGYLPKESRKKILLMSDDLRFFSGIASISRELVIGCAHHYNFVQAGGSINHPEKGKIADLSEEVGKQIGIPDASVKIYPVEGYGDPNLVRYLMEVEKPNMILLFTDPRYWIWFFQMEAEVRRKIPVSYLEIWDDGPSPLYNFPYYASCDGLFAISKQTYQFTKDVLDWADHPFKEIA